MLPGVVKRMWCLLTECNGIVLVVVGFLSSRTYTCIFFNGERHPVLQASELLAPEDL